MQEKSTLLTLALALATVLQQVLLLLVKQPVLLVLELWQHIELLEHVILSWVVELQRVWE